MTKTLVFVCTGNHCRSPIAEVLAADLAASWELDVACRSAGTSALVDYPAAYEAISAVEAWGLDLAQHRGVQLDEHLATSADFLIVMAQNHREAIERQWPDLSAKVIDLFPNDDVFDPVGQGLASFEQVRDHIAELLPAAFERMGFARKPWWRR